jgi:hypothetical protein
VRKPGVALDGELRKARVFGGRESKIISQENRTSDSGRDTEATGAVTRPPKSSTKGMNDRSGIIQRGDHGMPRTGESKIETNEGVIKRNDPEVKGRPERKVDADDSGTIRSPVKTPKINNDSESSEKPVRVTRPQPRERVETPTPRYEPPVRKYEPPPRSEPAPRYEPPQRSEPVRKYEPAPQRSEPPRSAPAPKSEPAPQKSEPAKGERPRPSAKEQP